MSLLYIAALVVVLGLLVFAIRVFRIDLVAAVIVVGLAAASIVVTVSVVEDYRDRRSADADLAARTIPPGTLTTPAPSH